MEVRLRYAFRRVRSHQFRGAKTESELMRVARTTVGAIVQRVVDRHFDDVEHRLDGLRHIGIDELSYRRHHEYVTVVVDHVSGRVVWSMPGKNAATLHRFFDELAEERTAAIESVTIDMFQAYISAVKERVPRARLVFNRFHVQRLLQDALDETRRDQMREAEAFGN